MKKTTKTTDNSTQYSHPPPVEKSCRMHRAIPLVSVLKMIDKDD